MNRITLSIFGAVHLLSLDSLIAEQDGPLPETPTSFNTRDNGGENSGDAEIQKKANKPKKVTYTAVTAIREWKNNKGTVIRARLLAFETGRVLKDDEPATLINDGQVRFLVEGKKEVTHYPIVNLSTEDQAFVTRLAMEKGKRREASAKTHKDPSGTQSGSKRE